MSVDTGKLLGPYICVFDVGAFQGDFARACLIEWPDCHVHSFEPLVDPSTVVRNGQWSWHAVALGDAHGVATMNQCTFLPSSSLLPMLEAHETAFPYTKGSESVGVAISRLAEFADVIVTPALLKIDVQGFELEVLRGAGSYLGLFDAVVLEVSHEPLYDGAPTPEQLANYLASFGFRHHSQVDALYHPKAPARLLQSDEFWVRA